MKAKRHFTKGMKTEVPKQPDGTPRSGDKCSMEGSKAPVRAMAEEAGQDTHHRTYHRALVCLQPEEGYSCQSPPKLISYQ